MPTHRSARQHNRIDLWYLRTATAMRRQWPAKLGQLLSEEERQRQTRLIFPRDRAQFLVAHVLLRTVLSHYAPVEPAAWRFVANEYGKPEIVPGQNPSSLRFNLAHCRGLTVCGVVFDHPIGVDCENTRRSMDYLDVARRCFAAAEIAHLESHAGERQAEAFFALWTLKEAYIKARGRGLSLPLDSFSVVPSARRDEPVSFDPGHDDCPDRWQFAQPSLGGPYQLAVAVQRPPGQDLTIHLRQA